MDLREELASREGGGRGRLITLGVLAALGMAAGVGFYAFSTRGAEEKAGRSGERGMDLDEQFTIRESRWRGRLITLGILAVIGLVIGVGGYALFFREAEEKARPTEDLAVGRATINANLIVSGVADAQLISDLSFRTSGRVDSVNVKVGDPVRRGDVLASLESEDLANSVATAQANLALAQARLSSLLEGASEAELAAAEQSVVSAEVSLDSAKRDLEELLEGPTHTELSAEEQAVVSAEAALNQAGRDRTRLLEGPTAAEIASAEQVVASAQTALNQAERDRTRLLDGPTHAERKAVEQTVVSAQAALNQAERALDELRDGPTPTQLAAAEQTVAAAEANLASAQAALERLTAPPSAAALAAANSVVAAAEQALRSAEIALNNARSNVASAEAALRAARTAFCIADPADSLCASFVIPLSSATVADLLDRLSDPATDPALLDEINALIQTNASYQVALNGVETAEEAVEAAEAALDAAEANRAALLDGPDDRDVRAAEAAVTAAEEAVALAELGLAELRAGPDQDDIDNAEDAVRSARAALDAAIARRDDVLDGPDAADVARADDAVRSARAALTAAIANRDDLLDGPDAADIARADDAVRSARAVLDAAIARRDDLVDPPDADDIARADDAVRSAQAALDAALARQDDLLDGPDESDVASARDAARSLRAGVDAAVANRDETVRGPKESRVEEERQSVLAAQLAVEAAQIRVKDAQIISPFDGTVAAIDIKPGEFTGVGSATPAIVLLTPEALVLKMNLGETDYPNVKLDQTGVVIFDAIPGKPYPFTVLELGLSPTVTQGVVTYEVTGALIVPPDSPRPAPGMSANGQIVTESRANVLAIPPRAIRRSAGEQVVDVRRNGRVEEQVIATGLSDINNVEVLAGLEEGDVLVVPVLVSGSSSQPEGQERLPSGIR